MDKSAPTLEDYEGLTEGKRCSCGVLLRSRVLERKDHPAGWEVHGFASKQWLSVTCPNGHPESLEKLGVRREITRKDWDRPLKWLGACFLVQLAQTSRNTNLSEDQSRLYVDTNKLLEARNVTDLKNQLAETGARYDLPWLCVANVELFVLDKRADYRTGNTDRTVDSMNHYQRGEYESFALEDGAFEALKQMISATLSAS